jgi:hypothetical protein
MAIWPVGPPKLMNPSFSQNRNASRKVGCRAVEGLESGGGGESFMKGWGGRALGSSASGEDRESVLLATGKSITAPAERPAGSECPEPCAGRSGE